MSAIDYYESALQHAPTQTPLRKDLANLYAKLEKHDKALRVIQQAPDHQQTEIKDILDEIDVSIHTLATPSELLIFCTNFSCNLFCQIFTKA